MLTALLPLLLAPVIAAATSTAPAPAPATRTPSEIVAAAPDAAWKAIAAEDLLVIDLAPAANGAARRVIVQLVPAPFSQPWLANIRRLATAHWWDGTSVNRVQDNYVVQWGDATEKKPLPAGLTPTHERDYVVDDIAIQLALSGEERSPENEKSWRETLDAAPPQPAKAPIPPDIAATRTATAPQGWHQRDAYAPFVEIREGWPIGSERTGSVAHFWPLHCYASVGVGRNVSPDAGSGAELYVVIGQAPRHLDRNIAVVGRVIEGIEHLSALPRGTEALGFYKTPAERTAIVRTRIAAELPAAERPRFDYLDTAGDAFARYVAARANRKDDFFIRPAGGVDICNLPVPIRRRP